MNYVKPSISIIPVENINLLSDSRREGAGWVNNNVTGCDKIVTLEDLDKSDETCPGNYPWAILKYY